MNNKKARAIRAYVFYYLGMAKKQGYKVESTKEVNVSRRAKHAILLMKANVKNHKGKPKLSRRELKKLKAKLRKMEI